MKSTLPNMVLSLAGIAIVAAAALAAVNSCTKSKISEGADTARMEALRAVSPEFDSHNTTCLLYTSDAADDLIGVDLGGRRGI